jgi:hypothetical protein
MWNKKKNQENLEEIRICKIKKQKKNEMKHYL